MNLRRYIKDESELRDLARLQDSDLGQLLLRIAADYEADMVKTMRLKSKINSDDPRQDVRYMMGVADAAGWPLQLQPDAMQLLQGKKGVGQ